MKKLLGIILFSMLFVACSNPLDKTYNKETAPKDFKAVSEKLDTSDTKLLVGSILRLTMKGEDISLMTYGQILDDGKSYKLEQERLAEEQRLLAEKAKKEEEERIRLLNEAIVASCFEKGFFSYKYDDYITYKFVFKNKTDKPIRAIKGSFDFNNLFDDKIKSISLVYDEVIPANSEVTYEATTDYNKFRDSDKALKNKELEDMHVVWNPEKIIFEDGTTLE